MNLGDMWNFWCILQRIRKGKATTKDKKMITDLIDRYLKPTLITLLVAASGWLVGLGLPALADPTVQNLAALICGALGLLIMWVIEVFKQMVAKPKKILDAAYEVKRTLGASEFLPNASDAIVSATVFGLAAISGVIVAVALTNPFGVTLLADGTLAAEAGPSPGTLITGVVTFLLSWLWNMIASRWNLPSWDDPVIKKD